MAETEEGDGYDEENVEPGREGDDDCVDEAGGC